jgi:glucosylceramidase
MFSMALLLLVLPVLKSQENEVNCWLTKIDKSALIALQQPLQIYTAPMKNVKLLNVDDTETYQGIDGFGFALTGGSAMLINSMQADARQNLLNELFLNDDNSIGTSYLRISIGASDLSDRVFSYNDLPKGKTDGEMKNFSIGAEKKDLIPVLKQILAINPKIKILGSPWSAPVWMKTNGKSKGGSLKQEYFDAYALYFVKYIQSMKDEGIRIDAITIQNEPLHPGNNPSMYMSAADQALFIKKSLGPAFKKEGIDTKIIIYDHNPLHYEYPIEVLSDAEANQYIDGTAFHMYEGEVDSIAAVHRAFPDKNLYFTEQWIGAPGNFSGDFSWHIKTLIIRAMRNWCRNVIEWNLAADPKQDPHTKGGCTQCLGAVTIDKSTVTRNPAYYIIGQASKFVAPGSLRIKSDELKGFPNIAFKTPEGKMVLLVQNDTETKDVIQVGYKNSFIKLELDKGSVVSLVWPAN